MKQVDIGSVCVDSCKQKNSYILVCEINKMEALIIDEGEWSNGMSSEEAELMSQLLGNCSLPNESSNFVAAPFWANPNADAMYINSSMFCISQGSSGFSGGLFPYENHYTNVMVDYSTKVTEGDHHFLNRDASNDIAASQSKKRSRLPCDEIGRSKKCSRCPNSKEDINAYAVVQASSSEEEYSCSIKGGRAPNPNKKARASRGSATDPQSLYARKRRERINERLRILQSLVPNGTKVDISTMLEEAVQYVKFLQLQIKVLSSDDMWMYAPIAYNGMDIGLDFRPQSS